MAGGLNRGHLDWAPRDRLSNVMFVAIYIGIEIANVEKGGALFLVPDKSDDCVLNQASQLSFAHREILGRLFRAEQPSGMYRRCDHNEFLLSQRKA